MNRLFLVLLLALPFAVSAQVYKTVDENGNTVFSDTPPAGGTSEKIELGTTNSAPPPPPVSRPMPAATKEEKLEVSVNIVSPAQDTTIAIGYAGNFSVEAQVNPPLAKGIYAQLLMDGTPVGEPQPGSSWALNNVFRGTHTLTVVITDAAGKPLAESPPITMHVLRAGLGH